MTLREMQSLFVKLLPRLIDYAYANGLELTIGEGFRTQEQADWNVEHHTGIAHSLHGERLAIDLQAFRNGLYLSEAQDYRFLGDFWKNLHPLNRWGGDIARLVDANHFSLSPDHRI